MHQILGYSWNELASLLGVVSIIAGAVGWLINHGAKTFNRNVSSALQPFGEQIRNLTKNIERLNANFKQQQSAFERLEKRVDEHDRRLDRHHEQIKTLFRKEDDNK